MPSSNQHPFDHLVVLMLENRSFDNLCGYLYENEQPKHFIPDTDRVFQAAHRSVQSLGSTTQAKKGEVRVSRSERKRARFWSRIWSSRSPTAPLVSSVGARRHELLRDLLHEAHPPRTDLGHTRPTAPKANARAVLRFAWFARRARCNLSLCRRNPAKLTRLIGSCDRPRAKSTALSFAGRFRSRLWIGFALRYAPLLHFRP